jgi:uncharacterized RDD family membrane protein YckC
LASVQQRAFARLFDTGLVLLVFGLASLPFVRMEGEEVIVDVPLWFFGVQVATAVVYETVLVRWRGQTLGKMIFGVRVADLSTGETPGWRQSSLRILLPASVESVLRVVVAPLSSLYILVYLSSLGSPILRGVHDKAAGTVVVRSR